MCASSVTKHLHESVVECAGRDPTLHDPHFIRPERVTGWHWSPASCSSLCAGKLMKEIAFIRLTGSHERELRFHAPTVKQAAPGLAVLEYETLRRAARLVASNAVFIEDRLNVHLEADRPGISPAAAGDSRSGSDADDCGKITSDLHTSLTGSALALCPAMPPNVIAGPRVAPAPQYPVPPGAAMQFPAP